MLACLVMPGMWAGLVRWRWLSAWVRRWRRCRWRLRIPRAQVARPVRRMRHLLRRRLRRRLRRGVRRARVVLARRRRIPPVVQRRVRGGVDRVARLQVRVVKLRRPRAAAVRRTAVRRAAVRRTGLRRAGLQLRVRRGLRRVIRGRVLWCRGSRVRRMLVRTRLVCRRRILLWILLCQLWIRLMR